MADSTGTQAQPPIVLDWHQADNPEDRRAAGVAARKNAPRSSHAAWTVKPGREEKIELLEEQSAARVQELIPLRYARMSVSPFTFYRGTALIMASDLATTPISGIPVQCVGDAHIANFGIFMSPTQHLVFDVNDFDETLPGPWEWDVKRLVTSVEICARDRGFDTETRRRAVSECVRAYHEAMHEFAQMDNLDIWYAHLDVAKTIQDFERNGMPSKTLRRTVVKAVSKDSNHAAQKFAYMKNGEPKFRWMPPELVPIDKLTGYDHEGPLDETIKTLFEGYRENLYHDRLRVLDSYHRYHDAARKVVGVGSVGTRVWVLLLSGRDVDDALVLQIKEAEASVLERFVGTSRYATHGERVVQGQKLIQTTADVLLGWTSMTTRDGLRKDYYVRQLWNGKGSIDLDNAGKEGIINTARMSAWALAHAHARTGDAIAIDGYMGEETNFDDAIITFAKQYADQNEEDYKVFMAAIKSGHLPCAK
ncbi:DUF2252 domain-containing protein [Bifidobacterium vansinderenii]|uniref:DUF2252 domain-containing protein n=1 Tax=Bifidobacterium vansinderenii TaxID=1984871 RepID=A0A229VZJ1_9BIFI|nr:DUF2252 domain-containing protein [Bifidobacterium vansinderenii]OXN01002.1 hypothetical protein Tam10B_0959 [Bifidobacterium vansinderenii]